MMLTLYKEVPSEAIDQPKHGRAPNDAVVVIGTTPFARFANMSWGWSNGVGMVELEWMRNGRTPGASVLRLGTKTWVEEPLRRAGRIAV